MHVVSFIQVLLLASSSLASYNDVFQKAGKYPRKRSLSPRETIPTEQLDKQAKKYLTHKTQKFEVDGDNFPLVPFPIGESYAGLLPINESLSSELFFWFFPSTNPLASDEIVVWLNGGPGCSSLLGLLEENGPFIWQSGTASPNLNPYSWTNLTNVVWIDQPVGTGLSQGISTVEDEVDVANQFMGFWKHFIDTFDLKGRKVYLTGESYAGLYVPYIAAGMLDQEDTQYFNVKGIQVNDPVIGDDVAHFEIPAVPMMNAYNNILGLNDSFVAEMNARQDSCGYTAFAEAALSFPPPVPLPPTPYVNFGFGCEMQTDITLAATFINPCFNIYHIVDYCPLVIDQFDYPGFFNDSDVQAALHVPPTDYHLCGGEPFGQAGDESVAPALNDVLASVIERTNNVLIGSGDLDFLIPSNGTLMAIQNMTWNGLQGFQKKPSDLLYVPYHWPSAYDLVFYGRPYPDYWTAGAGYLGTTHTERGLTFSTVAQAGHEIPSYSPGAAYRQLEFLLGRIASLTEVGDFTTQTGNFTGTGLILE